MNWLEVGEFVCQCLHHRKLSLFKKWWNKSLCWRQRLFFSLYSCSCSSAYQSGILCCSGIKMCGLSETKSFRWSKPALHILSLYAQSPCLEIKNCSNERWVCVWTPEGREICVQVSLKVRCTLCVPNRHTLFNNQLFWRMCSFQYTTWSCAVAYCEATSW